MDPISLKKDLTTNSLQTSQSGLTVSPFFHKDNLQQCGDRAEDAPGCFAALYNSCSSLLISLLDLFVWLISCGTCTRVESARIPELPGEPPEMRLFREKIGDIDEAIERVNLFSGKQLATFKELKLNQKLSILLVLLCSHEGQSNSPTFHDLPKISHLFGVIPSLSYLPIISCLIEDHKVDLWDPRIADVLKSSFLSELHSTRTVSYLLSQYPQLLHQKQLPYQRSPLHFLAAQTDQEHLKIAKFLFVKIDPTVTDNQNEMPLHQVVSLDMAKLLIDRMPARALNKCNSDGKPPLARILERHETIPEYLPIAEYLIGKGANLDFTLSASKVSPFEWAIQTRDVALFKLFQTKFPERCEKEQSTLKKFAEKLKGDLLSTRQMKEANSIMEILTLLDHDLEAEKILKSQCEQGGFGEEWKIIQNLLRMQDLQSLCPGGILLPDAEKLAQVAFILIVNQDRLKRVESLSKMPQERLPALIQFMVETLKVDLLTPKWRFLSYENPILCFCKSSEVAMVLCTHYPQLLQYRDSEGNSLLHPSKLTNPAVAKYLIENHGLDINAPDQKGNTPLRMFVEFFAENPTEKDYSEVIKILVEKGAKIDPNSPDLNPIEWLLSDKTAQFKKLVALTLFIEHSPALLQTSQKALPKNLVDLWNTLSGFFADNLSPYHRKVIYGMAEVHELSIREQLNILLSALLAFESGTVPVGTPSYSKSFTDPFYKQIKKETYWELIHLLTDVFNIELLDPTTLKILGDRSPLFFCFSKEAAAFYIARDPKILEYRDNEGNTLLHTPDLQKHSNSRSVLEHLIHTCTLDVNATNDRGQTPLHTVVREEAAIQLLARSEIKLDAIDNAGMTPLHHLTQQYIEIEKTESSIMAGERFLALHNIIKRLMSKGAALDNIVEDVLKKRSVSMAAILLGQTDIQLKEESKTELRTMILATINNKKIWN